MRYLGFPDCKILYIIIEMPRTHSHRYRISEAVESTPQPAWHEIQPGQSPGYPRAENPSERQSPNQYFQER
jgi:hypothetical protein